jgi:hypothetical protein
MRSTDVLALRNAWPASMLRDSIVERDSMSPFSEVPTVIILAVPASIDHLLTTRGPVVPSARVCR